MANGAIGDHLLTCGHPFLVNSASTTCRHDRFVRRLAEDLRVALRKPTIEPQQQEGENTRADIKAMGTQRGDDWIDVSFIHPYCSDRSRTPTCGNFCSLLNSAFRRKEKKHASLLHGNTARAVVPAIGARRGGWETRNYAYLCNLATEIVSRSDRNSRWRTALAFHRYAARIVCNAADALTIHS